MNAILTCDDGHEIMVTLDAHDYPTFVTLNDDTDSVRPVLMLFRHLGEKWLDEQKVDPGKKGNYVQIPVGKVMSVTGVIEPPCPTEGAL